MNTAELFINDQKLPKPLPKEELYILIKAAREGSKEALDKLVIHNIKLVIYEVTLKFKNVNYEKKDLVSIGNIGLIKAINTYDPSKGYEFSSYATKCIEIEILKFLRKLKKHQNVDSLDRTVFQDKDGNEIKLEEQIRDDTDLVENYEKAETYKIIREVVKELPDRDREIIMLHFGFYDNKIYSQKEIADKFDISQPYVSRLITNILKNVGKILESKGVIDLHSKKEKENIPKFQTIYEYFNKYTSEQVNEMLSKLTDKERVLVKAQYGEDLDKPVSTRLTKEQTDKFYGILVPKMKRILANLTRENRQRKPRQRKERISQPTVIKQTPVIPKAPIFQPIKPEQTEEELVVNSEMTKEDYIKMLELLKTPLFTQMMSVLSVKEAIIFSLKLGYIDGKYFSTESIAQFLGIEETEIIEITKKVLLIYKENINNIMDNAITVATSRGAKSIKPKNIIKNP